MEPEPMMEAETIDDGIMSPELAPEADENMGDSAEQEQMEEEDSMMNPKMMEESGDQASDDEPYPGYFEDHLYYEDGQPHPGYYRNYVDGVIGNDFESILFFHAAWCPYCIANNTKLEAWYAEKHFPRSVYKIDFDTADELKARFGVTNQDTFILIGRDGNEIKRVTFPSESDLLELLGTY